MFNLFVISRKGTTISELEWKKLWSAEREIRFQKIRLFCDNVGSEGEISTIFSGL